MGRRVRKLNAAYDPRFELAARRSSFALLRKLSHRQRDVRDGHIRSRPLSSHEPGHLGSGIIPNTPENLRAWVKDPQAIKPGNLMPNMQLNDRELDEVVTYLASLK